jgi:hypothetical protein
MEILIDAGGVREPRISFSRTGPVAGQAKRSRRISRAAKLSAAIC